MGPFIQKGPWLNDAATLNTGMNFYAGWPFQRAGLENAGPLAKLTAGRQQLLLYL
jgi:hypothetical protein